MSEVQVVQTDIVGDRLLVEHFHYDAPTGTFSAWAAELEHAGIPMRRLLKQLYNCVDIQGFVMYNAHTNGEVPFRLVAVDTDASGEDIAGWRFKCDDPRFPNMDLLVIND